MLSTDVDAEALVNLVQRHLQGRFDYVYNTENNAIEGGEYAIYCLADEAQCLQVAVRVPKAQPGPITTMQIQKEIDIRHRIDAAQICRFQPLLACDSTADNELQRPFMVIGWAEGHPLQWSESSPGLDLDRQNILHTIADVNLDLLRVHEQGTSALQWITRKIDRKIARAGSNNLPYGTTSECEDQKSLIRDYWIPQLDDAPHVLVHGDLSGNNIITRNNSDVTSIIDLGWAELVPLQFAAEFPRILLHEPVRTQTGFSWTQRSYARRQKDRDFYLQYIRDRADREGGLVSSYYDVLSRKDELNRYWWYTAASRSDIHQAMSSCGWNPMSAISGFYIRHPSIAQCGDLLCSPAPAEESPEEAAAVGRSLSGSWW